MMCCRPIYKLVHDCVLLSPNSVAVVCLPPIKVGQLTFNLPLHNWLPWSVLVSADERDDVAESRRHDYFRSQLWRLYKGVFLTLRDVTIFTGSDPLTVD